MGWENNTPDGRIANIDELVDKIKIYKIRVKNYIDENNIDFLSISNDSELLLKEGEKLLCEAHNILKTLDDEGIFGCATFTEDLTKHFNLLEEFVLGLKTSYKLLEIEDLFKDFDIIKMSNEYSSCLNILMKIKGLLEDPSDRILKHLSCYKSIHLKHQLESEMFLTKLKQCFEEYVLFNEKSFKSTKSVTIKITKYEDQLKDIIVALYNAKCNPLQVENFLLENVFTPLVKKPVSLTINETKYDFWELTLSYSLETVESLRPNYKMVFENMKKTFLFLSRLNVPCSNSVSVFELYANNIKGELVNLLIEECIMHSIPNTMDEMDNSTLVADIIAMNSFLISVQILTKDDVELLNVAEKVNVIFRSQLCANITNSAVEIMKKDLHDMVIAGENEVIETALNQEINSNCMLSKSALELVSLMKKVVEQTSKTDLGTSTELLSTIPAIIIKFLKETPKYHENLLRNIPQQTALFYNNCMFIANWMEKNSDKIDSCDELIDNLKSTGSKYLQNQIDNQKSQLSEILNNLDFCDATFTAEPQKIVRQCLRQLDLLKNVWQTILPNHVYNKTMRECLNDVCCEIIKKIITLEDISSSNAEVLEELCSMILERGPQMFKSSHEVIHVEKWMKLKNLKMLLSSSLNQISEQWSDGKGPLTLSFNADEVRHLIRALFQNTIMRANVLATIV